MVLQHEQKTFFMQKRTGKINVWMKYNKNGMKTMKRGVASIVFTLISLIIETMYN